MVQFGGGEGSRGVPLQRVAGVADRFAHRPGEGGEVQAHQARIRRVGPADHQAGFLHAGRGVDDGGSRHLEAAGDLAGGKPVLLPEHRQHDVLADPDAVPAHRLVGGLPEQLASLGEQGKQVGHPRSISLAR